MKCEGLEDLCCSFCKSNGVSICWVCWTGSWICSSLIGSSATVLLLSLVSVLLLSDGLNSAINRNTLNIPDTTQYYNISLENITFDRNKYSLYLVDNNYNITVNLNEIINYTFKTDNNKEDDRFMIYLQERVIDNESANYTNNVNWFVLKKQRNATKSSFDND